MDTTTIATRTGGEILGDALLLHGVEMAFAVCGESFLPLLDALHDRPRLQLVSCRHEAGAAVMAEAAAKLTGRPGVCLVSRGPGLCHATIGLHTAFQDSTPLVMFVGQVPRHYASREAQQEIDYRRMLQPLAKLVVEIDQAERIPEIVHRAFRTASSGRQGPVVLILPEDMLEDHAAVADCPPSSIAGIHPGERELARFDEMLAAAQRPLLVVGGSGWTDAACADVATFASAQQLPVCVGYRRLDLFDSRHDCYAGELAVATHKSLLERLRECDLVIALNTRLSEPTTQDYTLLELPVPRMPLVHIHAAAEELGSVYRPTLAIQSGPVEFARAAQSLSAAVPPQRAAWREALRNLYLADSTPAPNGQAFDAGMTFGWLREQLPRDAIVTFDAGAFSGWPQRFLAWGRPGRVLAPISGQMNYGVAAGVAAGIVHPERRVVVCVGDGGFTMGEAELATARRYGSKPIVLLFNNGLFGSVRVHQERRYPARPIGTDLTNPDFPALAASYGAHAETVGRTADFAAAWQRAVASGKPAVIEMRLDTEQLNSRATVTQLRRQR